MFKTPKSALAAVSRITNKPDASPADVLAVCDRAIETFNAIYWPDHWSRVQRAADDARRGVRSY